LALIYFLAFLNSAAVPTTTTAVAVVGIQNVDLEIPESLLQQSSSITSPSATKRRWWEPFKANKNAVDPKKTIVVAESQKVPILVQQTIDYIVENGMRGIFFFVPFSFINSVLCLLGGLDTEGLLKVPGLLKKTTEINAMYDRGRSIGALDFLQLFDGCLFVCCRFFC
jgi:hypothetical protein